MNARFARLSDDRPEMFGQQQVRTKPLVGFHRHRREVHRVPDETFPEKIADGGGGFLAHLLLRFFCTCRNMRGRHHLGHFRELPIGRRFRIEDIEPGARYLSLLNGACQRGGVDELAAGCINDADALLALRKPFRVEDVSGRRQGREMERNVIRAGAQVVERHELHAHIVGDLFRDKRIVRDYLHLEGMRASRHFLADLA